MQGALWIGSYSYVVLGIYPCAAQAERAVDTLVVERFSHNDISVLLSDNQSSRDFAHEKNTKAPEGTTTGVAAGGTIGGDLEANGR